MEEGHEVGTAGGSGHDAVKHWLRPFQGVMKDGAWVGGALGLLEPCCYVSPECAVQKY